MAVVGMIVVAEFVTVQACNGKYEVKIESNETDEGRLTEHHSQWIYNYVYLYDRPSSRQAEGIRTMFWRTMLHRVTRS